MITKGASLLSLLVFQGALLAQVAADSGTFAVLGVPTVSAANAQSSAGKGAPTQTLPTIAEQPPVSTLAPIPPPPIQPPATYTQPCAPTPSALPSEYGQAGNATRFWVAGEYVSWFVQGSRLPPLVTTSPAGTPLGSAGVIGAPGTVLLLGDQSINSDMRSGGRFSLGAWFDDAHTSGLEADVQLIGAMSSRFGAGSPGSQILGRPFVDATTSSEIAEAVSFPGLLSGSVAAQSNSDPLIIADAVWRSTLCSDCTRHVDLLVGYRYMYFAEGLQIEENLTSLAPLTQGTNILVNDRFATHNEFNGGLVGLDTQWAFGPLSLDVAGKLAIGNLRREVDISGATVITPPGGAAIAYPGGLLALPSNSGSFASDHFVCMPELDVTAGWQISTRLRATVGYSLLWLTDMVRPGDQVDRTVNPNALPPAVSTAPIAPTFTMRDSDFWVQGIRVGLEYRF